MYPVKQSTALTVPIFVHDVSGDAVTGLTNASFTKRISKNGGAFAAMTVTITELENGWYSVPVTASHSDTLGLLSLTFTNAGAKQVNVQYRVEAKLNDDLNDISATAIVSDGTAINTTGGVVDTVTQVSRLAIGTSAISTQAASYVLTTGVQSSGLVTDTETLDSVRHEHTDVGGVLDLYYEFAVGGAGVATEVTVVGRMNGNNDDLDGVYAWDWAGAGWDRVADYEGQNSADDTLRAISLLTRHTGVGANLGKVRIRFFAAAGLTSATLRVDQIFTSFAVITTSVGYALGRVWADTIDGVAGTESFVNGTADNPVLTFAEAKTVANNIGVSDYHLVNGSSIVLVSDTDNDSFFGDNWILDLGGQSVAGAYIQGAHVSGVGASLTEVHYEGCDVETASVQLGHFDFCSFSETVTHTLAGDYNYHNCYSKVAGAGAPIFTKTAGQATTVQFRGWSGGITISGLQAGDVVTISGQLGTVTLNGADATVEIRGSYKNIVNNLTGAPTVNLDGAFLAGDIASPAEITTAVWSDNLATYTSGMAGKRIKGITAVPTLEGTVNDVSATTTTFDTTLTGYGDSFFSDALVLVEISVDEWQGRPVASYISAAGTFTLDEPLISAPGNGVKIAVKATHIHPVSKVQAGLATVAKQDNIRSRLPAALVSGRIDSNVSAIDDNAEAAIDLSASAKTIVRGAAATGTLSTTEMTTDLAEATDDHYNGRIIIWTSGVLKDQATNITDYTGVGGLLTFTATTEAPSNSDTFVIV